MAQKTDLNVSPYYDDYSDSKNFHRVLFKPSVAIQARELTQLQSILQAQIERFGNHVFKEGAIVMGARCTYDDKYFAVKVDDTNPNGSGTASTESFRADANTKIYQGETSGVVAKVVETAAKTSTDPLTLFVKYLRTGNSGSTFYDEFQDGEEISRVTANASTGAYTSASDNNEFKVFSQTGLSDVGSVQGSAVSIAEGIVYTRGHFVRVPKQTLILEKYSATPSYKIGLDVAETLIDSTLDTSLLDNAAGSTNENAPGANRLQITLTLAKKSLTATDSTNFIELMRVEKGIVTRKTEITEYARLQDSLAQRTYDESGDYSLKPFSVAFREHFNNETNNGIYKSTDTPKGDHTKFIANISAGTAYVKGYRVNKASQSFVTFDKARDTKTQTGVESPFRIGNFIKVENMFGSPDFNDEGDHCNAYNTVVLYDTALGSSGSGNGGGNAIGTARVRAVDNDGTNYRVYLFDIQMFTKITNTGTVAFAAGAKIKGSSSNAIGTVYSQSGAVVNVTNVTGVFQASETITRQDDSSNTATINSTKPRSYNIHRVRRVHQTAGNQGGAAAFGADLVLDDNVSLTGTAYIASGDLDALVGTASKFTNQLEEGDKILFPHGETGIVNTVASDTSADLTADLTAAFDGTIIRSRPKLYKPDQTVAISGVPHKGVKTISATREVVRRQELVTVADSKLTLGAGSGETFTAKSVTDYVITNETTGAAIDVSATTFDGAGTASLLISGGAVPANGVICKVVYTVVRSTTGEALKTMKRSTVINVNTADPTIYGLGYQHEDISLGIPDVYKVRAIYQGGSTVSYGSTPTTSTEALPPSFVYTADSGNSIAISDAGTLLKGSVSGARGVLIENDGGTCFFYYLTDKRFQNSEAITTEAGAVGTCASVSVGSPEISNSFMLDDGQKDAYYGLASITRKNQAPTPSGKLKIIVDYFTHGAGNFFTEASYLNMEYEEIPHYVADRINPNATFTPTGNFRLRDSIDYRPSVAPTLTVSSTTFNGVTSATPPDVSALGSYPFAYGTQSFGTGSHTTDLHKIGDNTTVNLTHYLARVDKLFLTSRGDFVVVKGESSLNPVAGGNIEDSILIGTVRVPAYTTFAEDVSIKMKNHRRYTMRDIDRMSKRLSILESAVTLSMLETTTDSLQVLDADGFDKFKSGFIVDAFKGHGVGNPSHPDYQVAMDGMNNIARPTGYTARVGLSANTDKSNNVVINDNIVTLKYDSDAYLQATKASTELNVNPFNIANFIGNLTLSPDADQWHERTQMPDVHNSVEGNFDAIQTIAGVGTVWNEWQETSQGIPVVSQENLVEETLPIQTVTRIGGGRGGGGRMWAMRGAMNGLVAEFEPRWDEIEPLIDNWDGGGRVNSEGTAGTRTSFTEVTTTPTTSARSGIQTQVVEDIVRTENDRLVKMEAIPFMRSIDITCTAENMKPNSALNVYFDGIQVNAHCTPSSSTYGVGGATSKGTQVLTDNHGKCIFTYTIPNNNPSFATGNRTMKLTNGASIDDAKSTTSAEAMFMATGTMAHHQKTITSTRNARVIQQPVNETRTGEIVTTQDIQTETEGTPRVVWIDPLAQSFLVTDTNEEGCFLTKIDLYFSTKDSTGLPVTVDIREMENGYPTQRILPGSESTKNPDDVNISSNGQTVTTFEFKHPIYCQPDREYCFVVTSNSNEYHCWTGEMGKFDVHTQEPIDEQPYAGVLFKSQNSSTWTTEEMQDLKFTIYRAKFVSSGTLALENDKYGEVGSYAQSSNTQYNEETKQNYSLKKWVDPVEIIGSGDGNRFKVHQLSHGMYDTDSNVVIEGVVGDRKDSLKQITMGTVSGSGAAGTYTGITLANNTSGSNTDATLDITLSAAQTVTSYKINNPGSGFDTTQTLKIKQSQVGGSGTTTFVTFTINSVDDTLGGMPISLINATHEGIASFDMDSYEVDVTLGSGDGYGNGGIENVRGGGTAVYASRNLYYDIIHPSIRNLNFQKTKITPNLFATSANSPQGSSSSYVKDSTSQVVVIDDNNPLGTPKMIPSFVNEYEEMGNVRGLQLNLDMSSTSNITGETVYTSRISPVVDLNAAGMIGIMNRVNHVDDGNDLATNSTYVSSVEAEGDSNNCIYLTKRVNLENPATELKVMFDGFRPTTTDGDTQILTYYKLQHQDDSTPFESKGWIQFATTNDPDADSSQFRTYDYNAEDLDEFVGFSIKVVMKSKQTARVPAIRQFRGLALA